jgi:hypothetical protein
MDTSVRLPFSVVIDGRLDPSRARQVAVLAGRLGLAGVWLRWPWWPALSLAAGTAGADPAGLLGWLLSGPPARAGLLAGQPVTQAGWLDRVRAAPPRETGQPGEDTRPFGKIMLGVLPGAGDAGEWRRELARRAGLAVAELAVPPGPQGDAEGTALLVPLAPGRDLAASVAAAAGVAAGRAVLAEVTVSVGRTSAEARARAGAEELFTIAGDPAAQGLFGTLEECQAAAAALLHAGATELVCSLPLASDLPDVLAQLTAIAVGARLLRPGEPPSQSPPPPAGWGGRRTAPVLDAGQSSAGS